MKFEINSYILHKMGWSQYDSYWGLRSTFYNLYNLFQGDDMIKFFIIDSEKNLCFLIKEMSVKEKQKTKKLYKFISFAIPSEELKNKIIRKEEKLNLDVHFFDSNEELFKLIIQNESCNDEYKRNFRINKIFK
jgi:hypothetical protein